MFDTRFICPKFAVMKKTTEERIESLIRKVDANRKMADYYKAERNALQSTLNRFAIDRNEAQLRQKEQVSWYENQLTEYRDRYLDACTERESLRRRAEFVITISSVIIVSLVALIYFLINR